MNELQTIYVYGAKRDCSICVPAPSSEETARWLEAALQRKYRDQVRVQYIDYTHPLRAGSEMGTRDCGARAMGSPCCDG